VPETDSLYVPFAVVWEAALYNVVLLLLALQEFTSSCFPLEFNFSSLNVAAILVTPE